MRYPFLPPIGQFSHAATEAWKLAGHDLAAAHDCVLSEIKVSRHDGWLWLQYFEILRRQGQTENASSALRQAQRRIGADQKLEAACELGAGYVHWWSPEALRCYHKVEVLGRKLDDEICIGLGVLGQARCSRFTGRDFAPELVDRALECFKSDEWARADAWREAAAQAALREPGAEAGQGDVHALAGKAFDIHELIGDEVLGCYALLLKGRVERDGSGDRFASLRTAHSRARKIGAHDVAADVALFLVPALARGKTPESPEWHEALELAEQTFSVKSQYDDFGAAEVDLQLANLKLLADVDGAERHARAALAFFTDIGNELGVGNAWKALARCRLRRAQVVWQGSWIRGVVGVPKNLSQAFGFYSRSRKSYVRAGFERLARRVTIETSLVKSYELGLPIDDAVLESLHLDRIGDDVFTACKAELVEGMATLASSPRRAAERFALASQFAEKVGSGQLAAVAFGAEARAWQQCGEAHHGAIAAGRFLDHAEAVRLSIVAPNASLDLADAAREPYRFVLSIAFQADDARLALRVLERVRCERMAAVFRNSDRGEELTGEAQRIIEALSDVDLALSDIARVHDPVRTSPGLRSAVYGVAATALPGGNEALLQLRGELLVELERVTNTYFAAIYSSATFDIDAILKSVSADEYVLVLELLDGDVPTVMSLWRNRHDVWRMSSLALDRAAKSALDQLLSSNLPGSSTFGISDLDALVGLIPEELAAELLAERVPASVRIVPSGPLWAVPFLVLPLTRGSSKRLVDQAAVVLTPSLRLHADALLRVPVERSGALSWLSPEFHRLRGELAPFKDAGGFVEADRPQDFLKLLSGGRERVAVLTGHGNSLPGLAHAITLHGRPVVTAADLLSTPDVPPTISLASCRGLYTAGFVDEPLGLPTAALCSGATEVLGAHIELSTGIETTLALIRVYRRIAEGESAAVAVSAVVRDELAKVVVNSASVPITLWGSLNVIGVGVPYTPS